MSIRNKDVWVLRLSVWSIWFYTRCPHLTWFSLACYRLFPAKFWFCPLDWHCIFVWTEIISRTDCLVSFTIFLSVFQQVIFVVRVKRAISSVLLSRSLASGIWFHVFWRKTFDVWLTTFNIRFRVKQIIHQGEELLEGISKVHDAFLGQGMLRLLADIEPPKIIHSSHHYRVGCICYLLTYVASLISLTYRSAAENAQLA